MGIPAIVPITVQDSSSFQTSSSPENTSTSIVQVDGQWFKDAAGRVMMLRGVNLSGNSKLPYSPRVPSHYKKNFFEQEHVSFVNRPFPIDQAEIHFARLRHWGFNVLRFCITWEALEHAGPGIYDEEYLKYVVAILRVVKVYGFKCFIDPHQDVWSRTCGGSGAPNWTLKLAGLHPETFHLSKAAIVQNTFGDPKKYPKMIWATNYFKLAAATMYTLFFGGETFAPKCTVPISESNHVNIQEFLQSCFIKAFCNLAKYIVAADLHDSVVLGYDTLNEPSKGWIGLKDVRKNPEWEDLKHGFCTTPFQGMKLGEGFSEEIDYYHFSIVGPIRTGRQKFDPHGERAWVKDRPCIWAEHGVWSIQSKKVLQPYYFYQDPKTNQKYDFHKDFWKPFATRFSLELRKIHPQAIIFLEPMVNEAPPVWDSEIQDRIVYAPHFYDGITLMTKSFNKWNFDFIGMKRKKHFTYLTALRIGDTAIRDCLSSQLQCIKNEGLQHIGDYPCLIGEIGIPFDMDNKYAYKSGDYSSQLKAMDANMSALERNLLNYTIWNYCADNNHEWGDQWNGEDLSIYSEYTKVLERDMDDHFSVTTAETVSIDEEEIASNDTLSAVMEETKKDSLMEVDIRSPKNFSIDELNFGGRAIESFCRPFPIYTCGTPLELSFNIHCKTFEFRFRSEVAIQGNGSRLPTEIYIPSIHYGSLKGFSVLASDGQVEFDAVEQRLFWWHDVEVLEHRLVIRKEVGNHQWRCEIL